MNKAQDIKGGVKMKERVNRLFILFFLLAFTFSQISVQAAKDTLKETVARADRLMADKTVADLQKAIKELESVLEQYPDNYEALWRISRAYVDIIAIKTSALIEEREEFKPILSELGRKADTYARQALKLNPDAKEVVTVAALAHGYYSSSFGILKAILKGAAGRYKKLSRKLIKIDDSYQGAAGYKMMGKFYYVAPFPYGSLIKAERNYKKSLEKYNGLLEAHYYLGMIYLKRKKYDIAKKEFEFVINNPPHTTEAYYIKEFKEESKKQLDKVKELEARKKARRKK